MTDDADAVASNIAYGKTAYVNGVKITGTANIPWLIKYEGTYSNFTTRRRQSECGNMISKNLALFMGGFVYADNDDYGGEASYTAEVYDNTLTHSQKSMSIGLNHDGAVISDNNYVLAGGGQGRQSTSSGVSGLNCVGVFNSSLSFTKYQMNYVILGKASGKISSYYIFFASVNSLIMNYLNSSFSQSSRNISGASGSYLSGSSFPDNSLGVFLQSSNLVSINSNLTASVSSPSVSPSSYQKYRSGVLNDNILFIPTESASYYEKKALSVNKSKTASLLDNLIYVREYSYVSSFKNNVMVSGGLYRYNDNLTKIVQEIEYYDSTLTHHISQPLIAAYQHSATYCGDYLVSGGGALFMSNYGTTNVDIITTS